MQRFYESNKIAIDVNPKIFCEELAKDLRFVRSFITLHGLEYLLAPTNARPDPGRGPARGLSGPGVGHLSSRRHGIGFMLVLWRTKSLALAFGLAAGMRPSPTPGQVTCIHPPPDGGQEIVAAMQQKASGMRLQYLQEPRQPAKRVEGARRALVLLIDFPDYRWHTTSDSNFANADSLYTAAKIHHMLFSQQVYADPFSVSAFTGSMRDFYFGNSFGRFDIEGDVVGWFTAARPMNYYVNRDGLPGTVDDFGFGIYPYNAERLVEEAVLQADPVVDFRTYDNDDDGIVDALFVVHAGPGAEYIYSSNRQAHYSYLWSHFGWIRGLQVDGVLVRPYAFVPEDGTVGIYCHEFGHALGLPDLYDPDRSSEGVGEWCLMGSGSWCFRSGDRLGTSPSFLSAWSRLQLGWATAISFAEGETIRLRPTELSDKILELRSPAMPGGEYFLLENRQPLGFDAGLTRRQKDFALPAPRGLMIYHVDEAAGSQGTDHRRLVDVEEASPYTDGGEVLEQLDRPREMPWHRYLDRGNRGDNGDPFPGFAAWTADGSDFVGLRIRSDFDDFTTPPATTNGGAPSGIAVRDIRLDGDDVLFRVAPQEQTAVAIENSVVPRESALYALPNPAHGYFRLVGRSDEPKTTVRLYDVLGREVEVRPLRAAQADGRFEVVWRTSPLLPAGIYFAVAESNRHRAITKVLLLH